MLADPGRLAALRATGLLDGAGRFDETDPAPVLARAARLAARALHAPVAQVNLVSDRAQLPVAAHAEPPHDRSRWAVPVGLSHSFCQHVVTSGTPLVVDDARVHPLVRDSPAVSEAGIVGYLSVPIRLAPAGGDGVVLGTVCVVDVVPRRWTAGDIAILEDVAHAAVDEMAARSEARSAVQAAERQMARLLAAAGEGVLGTDAAGRTTFVNPAAERALGWTAPELIGRDQHELIHHTRPDGTPYPAAECPLDAARRAGRPCRVDDELFWRKDGTPIPVEYTVTPVIEAGRVTGTVLTFQDVTHRKRAEAAERSAREDAERANRTKSEFLATMSHELRTPLNAIGGYTELLDMGLRGPVTEAQRADLARIRRSQQHLLGLINNVLNFAKLEAGRAQYDISDVPVRTALDDLHTLIAPQLAASRIRYVGGACDPALSARADRDKLQQVLLNLLTNAAKFTDAPGTVTVTCDGDAHAVRIRVRDTGIGIPADRHAAIFDPFVQVDPRLARVRDGAGLGLAISRDLARGMGGDLTVDSAVGAGSTFTLTLPRAVGAPHGDAVRIAAAADEVRRLLAASGVLAALAYLNGRSAHRFTGLYRFDAAILHPVALYDREEPRGGRAADAPLRDTYCALVGDEGFATGDATTDERVRDHPLRDVVRAYCGTLVRDAGGAPVGTLCHFDHAPRVVPGAELPVLAAAASVLAPAVTGRSPLA